MRDLVCTTNDKKFMYKAKTGAGVKEMPKCIGEVFVLKDVIQVETNKKQTGETAILTALISDEGDMYTTLSPVVMENIQDMAEMFDIPNDNLTVRIATGQGGKGEFLTVEIV